MPGLTFTSPTVPASADGLRAEVRAFIREQVASAEFSPRCDSWLGGHSPAFSRALGERGWVGMTLPRHYGGAERTAVERFVVIAELLAAGAPVAAHWFADRQIGPQLLKYGTEAQRQRFLPPIARGECYVAVGMSEPDAGSDLSSVKTRAVRTPGGWQVTGRKVWTSHAQRSDWLVILCRTGAPDEHRDTALSQLMVDLHAPGVEIRPIRLLTGEEHFCEVLLDDVFVSDDLVMGTVGQAWRQVVGELAFERSGPERFLSTFLVAVEFLRAIGQDPPAEDAAVVGRISTHLSALYFLSLSVAAGFDAGAVPATEAAVVKDLGTRFERELSEAVRLRLDQDATPAGVRTRLTEAILHSPGFTLRGGTSEVLRGLIARGLVPR